MTQYGPEIAAILPVDLTSLLLNLPSWTDLPCFVLLPLYLSKIRDGFRAKYAIQIPVTWIYLKFELRP